MAVIESMFYQDTNRLRCLCWPGGDIEGPPFEYQMKVHLLGAVPSSSCAKSGLRKTATDHSEELSSEAVKRIRETFTCMDDLLKSVSNENEEIRMAHELRELPSRGFSLKMWVSNSLKVSESLPEAERVASLKDLHFEQLPLKRALGVLWNMRMTTCGLESPSQGNHRHEGVRFQLQAQSSILSVSFRSPFCQ